MQIDVRPACAGDAEAIARVHVDTWRSAYAGIVPAGLLSSLSYSKRAAVWARVIGDASQFTHVSEDGPLTVGFVNAGRNRGAERQFDGELYAIYVLESHQRRGVGKLLVRATVERLVEAGLRSLIVWVLRSNPAHVFYERLGGCEAGRKIVALGGADLEETAYGWPDARELLARCPSRR